ncbi:hypothetical protein CAOG_02603 [Capsaspora owczarzaki ATCC 30864]|uniref:hypothetical protein n=1 Tax=Capsaspora owczarzaki (strain ATCC 30864) TaxID=595528 RepID=UPI0001FE29E0|nr:hypothetical protein CAOG_02603 [Capsaspora owczarzaki ATCC 30864]|eukprot:XP_004349353.1 hypothetical protein CAOG_02603 [Capsaspora owczarzaki ATCC 30864]
MTDINVCDIDPSAIDKIKKFRFRKAKNTGALILKIVPEELKCVIEQELDDTSLAELANELPDSFPRYVVFSTVHTHPDGRISYPLMLIYISPAGTKPDLHMMYSGTKTELVRLSGITKVFEVRSTEELDDEWLEEKMAFFK